MNGLTGLSFTAGQTSFEESIDVADWIVTKRLKVSETSELDGGVDVGPTRLSVGRLSGLVYPASPTDAASRQYVDEQVADNYTAIEALEEASRVYIDEQIEALPTNPTTNQTLNTTDDVEFSSVTSESITADNMDITASSLMTLQAAQIQVHAPIVFKELIAPDNVSTIDIGLAVAPFRDVYCGKVTKLFTPIGATDAANKSYVDAAKNFVDLTPTTQPANVDGRVFYSSYWKKLIYYNGTRWLIVGDIPFLTPLAFDVGDNCMLCASLRKLDGWAGNCCRVWRADNTETDIGFDTTGLLDKVALDTFIGTSTTARVIKIYDQSGNGHDLVANTLHTYISVAFRLIDGVYIPEFEFNGNQYILTPLTQTLGMTDNNHFVLVNFRDDDSSPNETTLLGSFTGTDLFHQMTIEADGTGTIGQNTNEYTGIVIGGTPFDGKYHTVGMSKNGADAYMRLNGTNSTLVTGVVPETNNIQLRWGSRVGGAGLIEKWSNELIIWSAQPTTTILTNIESGMMNIWR
jgi:hypothetical protein